MFPDSLAEVDQWISHIDQNIQSIKKQNVVQTTYQSTTSTTTSTTNYTTTASTPNNTTLNNNPPKVNNDHESDGSVEQHLPFSSGQNGGVRNGLEAARDLIPYLQPGPDEEGRIHEFWQIWAESIPQRTELEEGGEIVFEVSASADLEKLSWRSSGPQHIFIQKMVDFFWNVGAPEEEIERLNEVGSEVNPAIIGSWIDMSSKGGMDGGWFFPVDCPLNLALKSSDEGAACMILERWASSKAISQVTSLGRDMGAAPPRQTEVKFFVPGNNYDTKLSTALSAYQALNVPEIPQEALGYVKGQCGDGPNPKLSMSVVTSSEGVVRLGVLFPSPSKKAVQNLCQMTEAAFNALQNFENALGVKAPAYVELQYLMKGYGYGVYKEGFDVVFHYKAGIEDVLV